MRCRNLLLALAVLPASLVAQVTDVGLTVTAGGGGLSGATAGQECGLVTCGPLPGGTVSPNGGLAIVHHAAPNSPFVLAIGFPGPCFQFPGIANDFMMALPPVTLAVGTTSAVQPSPCQQGTAPARLALPATAPSGLVFRLQSLGVSNSGALAFGPAIEATVR
jgi:hypothetical protein